PRRCRSLLVIGLAGLFLERRLDRRSTASPHDGQLWRRLGALARGGIVGRPRLGSCDRSRRGCLLGLQVMAGPRLSMLLVLLLALCTLPAHAAPGNEPVARRGLRVGQAPPPLALH